ncbi:hypothetical protein LNP05_14435 [Klebsiella pneumoniae subsp. pneumoniae]|nr:hypothetical protein [Klebsiella pneumoniae subsp. pneumoniae]
MFRPRVKRGSSSPMRLDTPAADKLLALMTAHRVWSRSPKIAAIPA